MKHLFCATALAAAALAPGASFADTVVWNQGPGTGTLNNAWSNETGGQTWADSVTLARTATVTGYTYYSDFDLSGQTAPDAFNLRIYADAGGAPGTLLVSENVGFTSASAYSTFMMPVFLGDDGSGPVWDQAEFGMQSLKFAIPAFTMQAGTTYWIGLSGNGFEAAQWSLDAPQDDAMAMFVGDQFAGIQTGYGGAGAVGDQMFVLTAVPEPGGLALAGLGLATVAALARRRRRAG